MATGPGPLVAVDVAAVALALQLPVAVDDVTGVALALLMPVSINAVAAVLLVVLLGMASDNGNGAGTVTVTFLG